VNIFVGNLPYSASDQDLADLVAPYGKVARASVIKDRESGRPRGFGFVEMNNDDEGRAAIRALNGTQFGGRALTVNEARPREEGRGGGGRGYGGGGV